MYSQCGCDVMNCATIYDSVTYFKIYYGDNITMNAPPLPPNSWGGSGYAWFTLNSKTSDDPNQGTQYHVPFANGNISPSYTINPLDYLPTNPSTGYFMCRTNSKEKSSSTSTCFYGRSYKVDFLNIPPPSIKGNTEIHICQGDSITLFANKTIGKLLWYKDECNGNNIGIGDSIKVAPSITTSYYVKSKNGTGDYNQTYSACVSVKIIVNSKPTIGISASTASVCKGDSVVLKGTGGKSYVWADNIKDGIAFIPNKTQNYTVTGTDTNGCINTFSKEIKVYDLTKSILTSSNGSSIICDSVDYLHSNSDGNFNWFYNGSLIPNIKSVNYFPTQSGFYQTIGKDKNGCNDTSTLISVTVNQTPKALIVTNPGTSVCDGDTVTLSSNYSSGNTWSTKEKTQEIKVTTSGNYFVMVNNNGCSDTSSNINIIVKTKPAMPTVKQNGNTLASSSVNGNQWNFNGQPISGANSQFYTINKSGFYSVTVTINGCSTTSTPLNVTTTNLNEIDSYIDFSIYPNPAKEKLTIDISNNIANHYLLKITNTLGQIVVSSELNKNVSDIDINNLYRGVYFIQLVNPENNLISIKKVIIE